MIPLAQQQLAAIKQRDISVEQSIVDEIQRAIASIPSFQHLPAALNHSDCVPTNAVMTPKGQAILIDWADAGWGELVLDLAWLLIMGMGSIPDGSPEAIAADVDQERLWAAIDGYCRYRLPTPAECAALVDAIRFVPAINSALEFCATCRGESPASLWQGWWARYQAVPAAAALVIEWINQYRRQSR